MKFFFIFFSIITLLAGGFWLFGESGSGAGIAALLFATIAVGVGIYNTVRFGSPLNEGKAE